MFFTFFAIYKLQMISMNKKPMPTQLTQMQALESFANI